MMNNAGDRRKRDPLRALKLLGAIGCGVVGGVLELLALQRCRFQARRKRSQSAWNR
ncbi:hypothetical protein [Hydrogenophaga aromaticivorans]|uniref:hypothetical protein n=1 Tax=Hydrogenophaga aromaticivorans TaxID=2610898 RepID=UPI0015A2C690|nr:hypothetical protein [Hydrogenophaga aromaticivorans]